MSKKYWYMRLKDTFFDSDELKILEGMEDGYLYSNIFLKMCLASLKNEGRLMLNNLIPYNANMIATITGHQIGTVERALNIFQEIGLIEVLDDGAIYMLTIQGMIGEGSTEADKKREYRAKVESQNAVGQIEDKSRTNVRHSNSNSKSNSKSKNIYSDDPDLNKAINDFIAHRKTIRKPMSDRAIELFIKRLSKLDSTKTGQIAMIEKAIEHGWLTVYKDDGRTEQQKKYTNFTQRDYDFAELERELLKQ